MLFRSGVFAELEAEQTGWVPGETAESPNRLDALVWAYTEAVLGEREIVLVGPGLGSDDEPSVSSVSSDYPDNV